MKFKFTNFLSNFSEPYNADPTAPPASPGFGPINNFLNFVFFRILPFNKELNNLNNEEAAKATYQALRESFDKAGV